MEQASKEIMRLTANW